jgi:hypothetical protein
MKFGCISKECRWAKSYLKENTKLSKAKLIGLSNRSLRTR